MRRVAASTSSVVALAPASSFVFVAEQKRHLRVRKETFFSKEAIPHAKRVSWAPHTTAKKQGIFAKLSRSNFYDKKVFSMASEPFCEEQVEAHRHAQMQDVYLYKYNVSPTHLSLRPE